MTEAAYECQDDCPLKDYDGNCYHRGDDGEVVQCVDNYKQWLKTKHAVLDDFLGTDKWRQEVKGKPQSHADNIIVSLYLEQLKTLGFPIEGLGLIDNTGKGYMSTTVAEIKNSKSVVLYYLILASKHPLGAKIWQSTLKYDAAGQTRLL